MLKNIHNTLLAVAILPMLATGAIELNIVSRNAASTSPTTEVRENSQAIAIVRKLNADKIDKYFAINSTPLAGYGMEFVLAAEKYGLSYNFLPAIAMIESTGGKFAHNQNPFGWGSAKISFDDFSHAIEVVAKNLGGANPRTAMYYANNSIEEKLWNYNEKVVPGYTVKVKSVMSKIENIKLD